MSRTTIMAPDELLDRLRAIAKEEGLSLGDVIREGMEWRAKLRNGMPSFVGATATADGVTDASERVDELVEAYLREKHSRY